MQPQDSLSVTRRSLDIEDYIDVARRHKAWIFGPAFAALVVSVVVAFLWPDTYLSTAVIRVVPPQVPETYFPPNITTDSKGARGAHRRRGPGIAPRRKINFRPPARSTGNFGRRLRVARGDHARAQAFAKDIKHRQSFTDPCLNT